MPSPPKDSLAGKFLIASPSMDDPTFERAVLLMVEHHAEGALALVLNRPVSRRVEDVWDTLSPGLALSACPVDQQLRQGGPCPGPVMMLHDQHQFADLELMPGLCFSAEPNQITDATAAIFNRDQDPRADAESATQATGGASGNAPDPSPPRALYFTGYSGWAPGQLEYELEHTAWLIAPARPNLIFNEEPDDGLWLAALTAIDRAIAMLALNPKLIPKDPSMN